MPDFAPVQRTRLADQVAGAIRDAILTGRYASGDRLPAERELAAQFDVNRSSVREALQQLSAWGLVDIRQGGGATVTDVLAEAGLNVLPWMLAPDGHVDPELMRDLLRVRVAMLGLAGELAAGNASPDDVAGLRRLCEELEAAGDRAEVQRVDYAFFEALVDAGGNRVLGLLAGAVGRVYEANTERFRSLYPEPPMITLAHRAATEAIAQRDGSAARAALEAYGMAALALFGAASRSGREAEA